MAVVSPLAVLCVFAFFIWLRAAPAAPTLAFQHATVVDVNTGLLRPDASVVIGGDRVLDVVEGGRGAPPGARVVDARGKYLIPGLWDMHVHVDDTGEWFFPLAVANGVTSIRDMGSNPKWLPVWRRMVAREAVMPRVLVAGPILTGDVADDDPRLIRVSRPADAAAAVEKLWTLGVDHVKVHDWLSRETYLSVVAAARARKLPVVGHVPIFVDAAEVSDEGQRTVEHLGNAWGGLLLDCSTEEPVLKRELRDLAAHLRSPSRLASTMTSDRLARLARSYSAAKAIDLARTFRKNGTAVTPTFYAFAQFAAIPELAAKTDAREEYIPKRARPSRDDEETERSARDSTSNAAHAAIFRRQRELLETLRSEGVTLLAGTDTAALTATYPGFTLHDELASLVEYVGLTPIQALQTATANPARVLGLGQDGEIVPGARADLVLLNGDPTRDIRQTTNIDSVVLRGRLLDRRSLDALLARVRAQSAQADDRLGRGAIARPRPHGVSLSAAHFDANPAERPVQLLIGRRVGDGVLIPDLLRQCERDGLDLFVARGKVSNTAGAVGQIRELSSAAAGARPVVFPE
jgi:hypothetical protein